MAVKIINTRGSVNAYENGRYNVKLSKMRGIVGAVVTVSMGIIMMIFATYPNIVHSNGTHPYIYMVQNGCPEAYPEISYGDAFKYFFEDCHWRYFYAEEKDKDVVEFHGNCLFDEEKINVGVQFLVDYEEGTFELHTTTIDNESQTKLISGLLMVSVFESYGSSDGIGALSEEALGNAGSTAYSEDVSSDADEFGDDFSEGIPEDEGLGSSGDADALDERMVNIGQDLTYPIMSQGYADGYSPCPVMVNAEDARDTKSGTYEEMLASLINDGTTMYAQPMMYGKKIYTATKWDAPQSEWYDALLTYDQFLYVIGWMQLEHEGTGAEDIYTTGTLDDGKTMSGRWSGGTMSCLSVCIPNIMIIFHF